MTTLYSLGLDGGVQYTVFTGGVGVQYTVCTVGVGV